MRREFPAMIHRGGERQRTRTYAYTGAELDRTVKAEQPAEFHRGRQRRN